MTFDLAEGNGSELTVAIHGELDITNVDPLAEAVEGALKHQPRRLVVDLGGCRFADSSAIALWVQWATNVGEFELRHPSTLLRRVIGSMGLSDTLNVTA
jgi:anti-anti-sigma factor